MNCTTHHNACDCREAAIAELIKAKDAEIAWLKRRIEDLEYKYDNALSDLVSAHWGKGEGGGK